MEHTESIREKRKGPHTISVRNPERKIVLTAPRRRKKILKSILGKQGIKIWTRIKAMHKWFREHSNILLVEFVVDLSLLEHCGLNGTVFMLEVKLFHIKHMVR